MTGCPAEPQTTEVLENNRELLGSLIQCLEGGPAPSMDDEPTAPWHGHCPDFDKIRAFLEDHNAVTCMFVS